jgi:predicted nucleic acid-binding Zn ribbon protein
MSSKQKDTEAEKDLAELFKDRVKDRKNYKSRRAKALEAMPHKFSELLVNLYKQDPETLARIEENRALLAWEGYVGEAAGRVSQALRVRSGTLIVRVTDPIWMQQLHLLKRELLRKYRAAFPRLELRDIFFTRNAY